MSALGIFAIILGLVGIIGSIVPALPGPPLSWVGLLLAYFAQGYASNGEPMSTTLLLVFLAITAIVTVLDYVVPAALTKATGGSKAASIGAIVGLFAGMILTPVGMIAGSLLGAFIGELIIADKSFSHSIKAALGAFLGFIAGTGLKLIASGIMLYYIFIYAF